MVSLLMSRPSLDELPPLDARVERATTADLEGLASLLDASFSEDWDAARVQRELFDDATVESVYLVRSGDRILATASARVMPEEHPGAGYLHWVASDPQQRGRGLGYAVTVSVLHDFAARGLTSTVLETDDERSGAIRMYLGMGYIPVYRDQTHEQRWSIIFQQLAARRAVPTT